MAVPDSVCTKRAVAVSQVRCVLVQYMTVSGQMCTHTVCDCVRSDVYTPNTGHGGFLDGLAFDISEPSVGSSAAALNLITNSMWCLCFAHRTPMFKTHSSWQALWHIWSPTTWACSMNKVSSHQCESKMEIMWCKNNLVTTVCWEIWCTLHFGSLIKKKNTSTIGWCKKFFPRDSSVRWWSIHQVALVNPPNLIFLNSFIH